MSLPALRVLVASGVDGLAARVRTVFAASALARTRSLELEVFVPGSPESAADAEILLVDPGLVAPALDTQLPSLRWLQSSWAGVNAIVDGTKRQDYVLTRLAGRF